jgi:hypothetical protein
MPQADYIGYKKIGDLTTSGAAAASSGARVFATGGADISADIALIASGASFVSNLYTQWTSHPAADARDFIANAKPKIAILDPYNRLISVIAYSQKINPKAKDVDAAEWLLWYRQNYPNDYMQLTPDAKNYWNTYLNSIRSSFQNGNNLYNNLQAAMFTTSEINYNATPLQSVSNLLTSATSGTTNWVLYGAIGLGIILLIKNLSK